ncbi:MAG: GNAT family N-acetyltransferase [Longimicrobiales bacterium]|nr:GNAT family N-acetyltransferase [Longimicrobiales bacterium]
MTHAEIRPARFDELPAVRDLFVEVVRDVALYNTRARESEIEKYPLQHLEALHREDPRFILVAAGPSGLDAFAICRDDDDLLWLSCFGVRAAARGRRLSAQMLSHLRVAARDMGYWKVWCDARDTNAPSIRALEGAGFRQVCRLSRHWYGQDYLLLEMFVDVIGPVPEDWRG